MGATTGKLTTIRTSGDSKGGLGGPCPHRFLLAPPFGLPSFFLNFKIVWWTCAELLIAFCKNTGHFVNSARSKLCRNS